MLFIMFIFTLQQTLKLLTLHFPRQSSENVRQLDIA